MTSLTCKPVSCCRQPAYPTRLDVETTPDLLDRHVPYNWLSRTELSGALATLLAVNAGGCSDSADKGTVNVAKSPSVVAPIFEHGEGRGATGCVVVSPPVFLSEEEALTIIREQLAEYGIRFTENDVVMPSVKLPSRKDEFQQDWITGRMRWNRVDDNSLTLDFEVDLRNPESRIAVEYVSESDLDMFNGNRYSSVQSFETKEMAEWLVSNIKKQGRGVYVGVFYDPLSKLDFNSAYRNDPNSKRPTWQERREQGKAESSNLLRQQVKDFAEWLKGQGVI